MKIVISLLNKETLLPNLRDSQSNYILLKGVEVEQGQKTSGLPSAPF